MHVLCNTNSRSTITARTYSRLSCPVATLRIYAEVNLLTKEIARMLSNFLSLHKTLANFKLSRKFLTRHKTPLAQTIALQQSGQHKSSRYPKKFRPSCRVRLTNGPRGRASQVLISCSSRRFADQYSRTRYHYFVKRVNQTQAPKVNLVVKTLLRPARS